MEILQLFDNSVELLLVEAKAGGVQGLTGRRTDLRDDGASHRSEFFESCHSGDFKLCKRPVFLGGRLRPDVEAAWAAR